MVSNGIIAASAPFTSRSFLLVLLHTRVINTDDWPANSLDLNPVEFSIRGALQQNVRRSETLII